MPKRLRPFLHYRPRPASAVLHVLLRALRATLRGARPTAPADASCGAVSFLHRFGSSLNPHFHYHLCVVDGLFEKIEEDSDQDPTAPSVRLRFHEATALTHELLERLQHTTRSDQILSILPRPDPAGGSALRLSALEFPDHLAKFLPPPPIHQHRYHGVFAPNAPLRPLVTARAREENVLAPELPGPPIFLSRYPPRTRLPSQRGQRRGHRIPPPSGRPGGPLI